MKIKKIKNDILEDKVILDGKEYPSEMFLDAFEETASIMNVSDSLASRQGAYKVFRFNTVRLPDKIDGVWLESLYDSDFSFPLFAGWREYYPDDRDAGRIYYEFDTVILPRCLKDMESLAFGEKDYDVANTPNLFISSDDDCGEKEIEIDPD